MRLKRRVTNFTVADRSGGNLGDASGWVAGMRCQKMELGEPDASGRRRPVATPGSDFQLDVDTVIYALGTTANPIIAQTTQGLENQSLGIHRNRRGDRHDIGAGSLRRR